MPTMNSLIGAVAGAGLMYVLDPVSGARRRAQARDQMDHARRQVADGTGTILRDAQHRGHGLWTALVSELAPGDVPDHVLEDRIRARLGMLVRYPRLVQVRCENSNVFLTGLGASDEIGRLVRRIRAMHGVGHVENRIELRSDPADLPGAQAPVPPLPPAPRMDLTRRRWSPSVRTGGAAFGGGLVLDGMRRGGVSGVALGLAGILVLFRAMLNEPLAERITRRDRPDRAGEAPARSSISEPAALSW